MYFKVFINLILCCGLFGFLKATAISDDQEACPQICPLLYEPVCATDGKIFKEFSNECELSASNCRLERSSLKTYVSTLMDWCSTELVENLEILFKKLNNLDITKPECLKPCPMIYKPVCISNGKYRAVASNDCLLETLNCALGYKDMFKVIGDNSC